MLSVNRLVAPEILDGLDAADERAVRSRRDLRLVNWFMRGEEWILSELRKIQGLKRVVDLGAGSGCLANAIVREIPGLEVECVDLASQPLHLDPRITWWQGDVCDYEGYDSQTVVVANLFLHHFDPTQLESLGARMQELRGVLAAEPYRGVAGLMMSRFLFPFVNEVTRHDMVVSIRAGFKHSELAAMLGLDFSWHEKRGLFGGIRLKGIK